MFFTSISCISQEIQESNLLNKTFVIDSIDNLLRDADLQQKISLLDTLGALTENQFYEQSILYYGKIIDLPDTIVDYKTKLKALKKIIGIYNKLNRYEDSEYYWKLYAKYLASAPLTSQHKYIRTLSEKRSTSWFTSFNRTTVVIYLIILIVLLIIYLTRLNVKLNDIKDKTELIKNEISILQTKNNDLKTGYEEKIKSTVEMEYGELSSVKEKIIILKKELKQYDDLMFRRNNFLVNIDPDVNTTLGSMLGFSKELLEDKNISGDKQMSKYSKQIVQKTYMLYFILKNMVDLATFKINALTLEPKSVSLKDIIANFSKLYLPFIDNNNFDFVYDIKSETPNVIADEEKITRIIYDINANIIERIDKGEINIKSYFKQQSETVILEILCTNKLFSEQEIEILSTYDTNEKLDIDKIIKLTIFLFNLITAINTLKKMNGNLRVSQNNNTTTITISLQADIKEFKKETINKENMSENKKEKMKSLNIFLVEDDRMNRLVIETMLKDIGTVVSAVDGEETLKIVSENYQKGKIFDVMLFDINLPAPWNGIILMQKIRNDFPEYKNVPCIAQTAYALGSDKEKFLNEGFDDYLTKPINKSEMITMIYYQIEIFKQYKTKKEN
jgi:CheY-like chemotaxis protein